MRALVEPRALEVGAKRLNVAPEKDLAHRLALWLADVSSEVALAALPEVSPTPMGAARSPRVAGPAR